MKITKELLPNVFVLENQKFTDNRGFLSVPFNAGEIPACQF
jgi:dTDP-4-dehydrorhamnose 3,5-epimerase-like enzyme